MRMAQQAFLRQYADAQSPGALKSYPEPPAVTPASPASLVKLKRTNDGDLVTTFLDIRPKLRAAGCELTPLAESAVALDAATLRGQVNKVKEHLPSFKLRKDKSKL